MTQIFIDLSIIFLFIFLLLCIVMMCNLVYMDWKECSHWMAMFYIGMIAVTAISYWCFILKIGECVRGLL